MKLRKLFALLMTAVMLFGMVPASHAELNDCNHDWDSGQWLSGAPANCQDSKPKTYTCTICKDTRTWDEYGPCNYIWSWGSHVPSCEEKGLQNGVCSVCGEVSERETRGPHSWGDWHGTEGTCLEPGREERSCHYCGTTEYRTGSTGAHDWGAWEKTKTGTCVEAGEETRACGLCGKKETRTTTMGAHQWGNWATTKPGTCVQEGAEQRSCSVCGKTETRKTGGGGHKYGDYTTVKEPTCVEKGRKEHYCEYCGAMEWGSIPMIDHAFSEWYTVMLPAVGVPGLMERKCSMCGLTEEKETPALEGDIVIGNLPNNNDDPSVDVNLNPDGSINVFNPNPDDTGYINGGTVIHPDGQLSLNLVLSNTPANGHYFVPDEVIEFVISYYNSGDVPLVNVKIVDPLITGTTNAGGIHYLPVGVAAPEVTTVRYRVTDMDAAAGSIENMAYVNAFDEEGNQYVEYSNTVTVPCGFPEGNDPFGIFHSVAVVKAEESMPLNGQFYTEGEVIHYTITYTNDGELPLTDVEIWDILDVSTPIAHAETLQPGESRVCYYQHTVTAEDVAAGSVINIAHASYPVSNAAGFVNSCSNMVVSKTNAYDWMWGTPLFPMVPTPGTTTPDSTTPTPGGYTPGTGWTTLTPVAPGGSPTGGELPPFGTIDTDKLRSGNSYCERTITGRDNVSVSYDTSFCAEHADTQASALLMQQAAATPELQAQAASYAVALWQTEVKSLYQKVYEAADPLAKAVVMTEYTRFLTEAANYEVLLKLLHPEQPALAAQMIAAMWEDKCVTLCNEAHAEASERKDSLLGVTPSTGAASTTCNCTVTAAASGQTSSKQNYCPVHGFPFSMIDMLLQGQNTAEAWAMVRQIWGVELTNAYNQISAKLGDNRILAMAEYNALTQWMMAREASLMALYPDNPEVVAQAMVKLIMDRVNDLCPTGK